MFLKISNPDDLDLDGFCEALIPALRDHANNEENQNKELANVWTEYFKSHDLGWYKDIAGNPITPTFEVIVDLYFSNLIITKVSDGYMIAEDPNILLNYTDIKIDTLATMINDGVLTQKGYPYFENVFDEFAGSLQELYEAYLLSDGNASSESAGEEEE